MKCLTISESRTWLESTGLEIDENRHLISKHIKKKILTTIPTTALPLHYYCLRLVDWLPKDQCRFFWMTRWDSYPPEQIALLEQIRVGSAGAKAVIDTPGHLFEGNNTQDATLLTGLTFLNLVFNWDAYIIVSGLNEWIHLGDECVAFYSTGTERMKSLAELTNSFKLKTISNVKEAWEK